MSKILDIIFHPVNSFRSIAIVEKINNFIFRSAMILPISIVVAVAVYCLVYFDILR